MENQNKTSNSKEFGLSSAAVGNRKTVFLVLAILVLMGMTVYQSMPREAFPEVEIPEIYVGVPYPGNSHEIIQDKIIRPLENEINTIKNVDVINSTAIQGYASVQVKFKFVISPDEAKRLVEDAVTEARSDKEFPNDLPTEPTVQKMDPTQMPIINLNLSGNYPTERLLDYAELLEDKIEAIPQISGVDIRGSQTKKLNIEIRKQDAEAKRVSFGDIEGAIQQGHFNIGAGDLKVDGIDHSVIIDGKIKDWRDFGDLIVKNDEGNSVHLHEVADVYFGDADTTSYARQNDKTVLMLDIKKRSGENIIFAIDELRRIVEEELGKSIPNDITVEYTNDQSIQIRDQISNLENSIIFGIILVVLVLLFFLGVRNALFVGVAIPLSMFMSFILLNMMGVTLNVMVLFSLVLALGMLVDNGIVVVENVYRWMDEGYSATEAAKKGVGEVAWPIIASTATTLAAFVPLALWPGIMGEFMQYLPITLMIVLGSSLFVALVINPVLTAAFMKVDEKGPKSKTAYIWGILGLGIGALAHIGGTTWLGNLGLIIGGLALLNLFILYPGTQFFQNKMLPRFENAYQRFLSKVMIGKRSIWIFFGTIGLLFFSFILIGVVPPKVLFFPENQPQYINVFVEQPVGMEIKSTNEICLEVKQLVDQATLIYFQREDKNIKSLADLNESQDAFIESVIEQVGEGTSDPMAGPAFGNTPHKARITINFAQFQDRDGRETSEYKKVLDSIVGQAPFSNDVKLVAEKNAAGPPQGAPVNIEITGNEGLPYIELLRKAETVIKALDGKVTDVSKLKLNVETGKAELPIIVDKERANDAGVNTAQIATTIRTSLFGKDVATYKDGDKNYDIALRFGKDFRGDINSLLDQKLIFMNNRGQKLSIPIRSVIEEPKRKLTFGSIKRKDLKNMITIQSGVVEGANPTEVVDELKGHLADFLASDEGELFTSEGFDANFTGQMEEQAKEMEFLSSALLIAVFLILLIIVAQFNSFSTPAIILMAVILSLIGVFLGLVISRQDFVIMMTMIGIISLAGIVVNNAIVLIDYTNLIRKDRKQELGLSETESLPVAEVKSAIIKGGQTRLRPVLLTAITTVLGLIPLATGLNIDFISWFATNNPNIYVGGDNVMFFGPMSWTIIYGLTFATFLTLIVIPVMYYLLYRFKLWLYTKFNWTMRSDI